MIFAQLIDYIKRFWNHPTLPRDAGVVLLCLVTYRFVNAVPVPGVDISGLQAFFERSELFGFLNIVSGGGLNNFSLLMLGVGPFITASIIVQLMTVIIPRWEELSQEGEQGTKTLMQYTRILTVPLALLQGYGYINYLQTQSNVLSPFTAQQWVVSLACITAGSVFLMWLGEIISERKIGNGSSLIIFAGIIAQLPLSVQQTLQVIDQIDYIALGSFLLLALLTVVFVVFMNDAQKNVPIHYARLGALTAHGKNFLPLKVNATGVIPVIFAVSVALFPTIIAQYLVSSQNLTVSRFAQYILTLFQNQVFYGILYFILVIAFTWFSTSIFFQPKKIAENLQKNGGFIPGVRPGLHTEEFLVQTMNRIIPAGATFLAAVAVMPFIAQSLTGIATIALGGTSILIVVSVVIDTVKKIQGKMVSLNYDNM